MADIVPFPAIRPAVDKAPFVVSRSYDDYGPGQRKAEMESNPFSFLHIIDPGFKFNMRPQGPRRLELVRNRYLEFLEEGILIRDAKPCFYIYEARFKSFDCLGVFCATPTSDYRGGIIRPHEDTLSRREILFADYLEKVRFNAEPVLLTYPDDPGVAALLEEARQRRPEYHFTTPDRVGHRLWVMDNPEQIRNLREAFGKIPAFYIADGHHRSASSDLLARRMQARNPSYTGTESFNFFMSYLIPESHLHIRPFYRFLTDLSGMTPNEILVRLDSEFRVHDRGAIPFEPSEKHSFSMYLDGRFYALFLRSSALPEGQAETRLDSRILNDTVLGPIFGITDPRHDQRLHYRCMESPGQELKAAVDRGDFATGFGLVPVSMEVIRSVADSGRTMPPKSTFVEPKLRSGLTIYDI